MRFRNTIHVLAVMLLLNSCAAPKIAYFQDRQPGDEQFVAPQDIRIRPKDKISILVSSSLDRKSVV